VEEVGFTGDHMITRWSSGVEIDDPDGSAPVWTSAGGASAPVCYTKGTPPTMFAKFTVTPSISPAIAAIRVRASAAGTVIGSADNCRLMGTALEDGTNTDGKVDAIGGGGTIPFSNGVKRLETTIYWEVSPDNGATWCSAGSSGPITTYWVDASPNQSPLYDLALDKACGYVAGYQDVAGRIRAGIHGEVRYDPGDGHLESNPLTMYAGGGHVCADFANLMAYLAQSVGLSAHTEVWWGGISWNGCDAWVPDKGTANERGYTQMRECTRQSAGGCALPAAVVNSTLCG